MQRIMIAGTGSGCGKTTVTCAVLSALRQRGIRASAFKCGPDYIDPMFYREILKTPSHNLDCFFCEDDMLCALLKKGSKDADFAVIEGAMGFYDGGRGSAYCVSEITKTPVVSVLNCRGMKESIGAVMLGFLHYRLPNRIAGFIFNQLPERLIPFVKQLCAEHHTGYFGCLPSHEYILESRHLGLVTAAEISDIHLKLRALGKLAEQYICIDDMMHCHCDELTSNTKIWIPMLKSKPAIAVARDRAFCFLYEENLSLLRDIGCEISFFSPIADAHLPDADGLLLCGGYPELYAEQLSSNQSMLSDIRTAVKAGMPVIAECGGFMYLHEYLKTAAGKIYPMASVISGTVFPTNKLQRFGYVTMRAHTDSLLCKNGKTMKTHEFHYWDSDNAGCAFTAKKADGRTWECGHVSDTMYAGFPHLYFPSDLQIALRFASACACFGGKDGSYSEN